MSFKNVICIFVGLISFSSHVAIVQAQKPAADAKHAHPTKGPHGGELLEIGKEEFHVELLIDESNKQMIVHLLDHNAKENVVIDDQFLAVNLLLAGKPVQIKLKAMPIESDAKGKSSRFGATSPELMDALHSAKSDPKLAVRIGNKSYVVKIAHKHDHAGHEHAQQPVGSNSKKR